MTKMNNTERATQLLRDCQALRQTLTQRQAELQVKLQKVDAKIEELRGVAPCAS